VTTEDLTREFGHLWNGSQPGWVLVRDPDLAGGFSIYNKSGVLLHVENEDTKRFVCERMRAAGCEILDRIEPVGDLVPTPLDD
jgi:hypothetical protein